jgi:hypothetical protein
MAGAIPMAQILNMNTEQKIIERLRGLPPHQLDEVIQFIDFIVEKRKENAAVYKADDVKRSILALRGRGKGEQLVKRLLQSRREDQTYDERK